MFAHLVVLTNLLVAVMAAQDPVPFNTTGPPFEKMTTCDSQGPLSCSLEDPSQENLCCYESPGGLILQTQFWDTSPPSGPGDSWTIHGLWPDNCDGSYSSDCDPSRNYRDISQLLTDQGASDTLSFMKTYWVDIHGQNEQFWEHEWWKHGTCYSTLQPSCLPSGSPRGAEAVAFFQQVVALFKTLPTYDWLASQGITPSRSQTYTLEELTSALKAASGFVPEISCSGGHMINEISWYFYITGSLLDGGWNPIDAPKRGSCASTGLRYYPK
ncbi:ribonuclease T2-like protein [Russula earlei]|uniref:Ribonuclease T2-like protein n=1 Tax=Russula earlei TaxID=71964 RepID=A0ACC0U672_9AGAM|nr:ribonuclease T2-like protein [Russula earlei]